MNASAVLSFGPPLLSIVQLLCAVPLGVVVAMKCGGTGRRVLPLAWVSLGIAMMLLVVGFSPAIASALDRDEMGFLGRSAVRTVLALAIVTPWLVPIASRWRVETPPVAWVAGVLLATLPPLSFALRLTETLSAEAASHLDTGRLAKARAALVGLVAIGSWRLVGSSAPVVALGAVERSILAAEAETARPLGPNAGPSSVMQRAFRLAQIGREDDAAAMLEPVARVNREAALLLASVDRDRERWSESERGYRRVLTSAGPLDAATLAMTYDGLIDALRFSGRGPDAIDVTRDAARAVPRHAGHFAMQRGRLELDAGRPLAAMNSLSSALKLDPSLGPQVAPLIRQVKVRTPACLLQRSSP